MATRLADRLKYSANGEATMGRGESCRLKIEAAEHIQRLETLVSNLIALSGHGYDCLPDGWVAVKYKHFKELRDYMSNSHVG